jgi:Rieske Fe-S protein
MDRRKFIGDLGSPVFAVCAVCLGACSKSSSSPSGGGNPVTPPTGVNFNVDLNSQLTTVGASLIQSGVIVVRLAAGNSVSSFTALQALCTHGFGFNVAYHSNTNNFICPHQGSTFTTNGTVTQGPAPSNLKAYNIAISGSVMTVTG